MALLCHWLDPGDDDGDDDDGERQRRAYSWGNGGIAIDAAHGTEGNSWQSQQAPSAKVRAAGNSALRLLGQTRRSQSSGFYAVQDAPPGLLTGTTGKLLAVWVVASVAHARAAAEFVASVRSTKPRMATPSTTIPIRASPSAAFHHDARHRRTRVHILALSSVGIIEESGRGAPHLIHKVNRSMNFVRAPSV